MVGLRILNGLRMVRWDRLILLRFGLRWLVWVVRVCLRFTGLDSMVVSRRGVLVLARLLR